MLTTLWDSWMFSPHMLLSSRHRGGSQHSQNRRSPCTAALLYLPTSSRNAVKLLTAPTQVCATRGTIIVQKQKEVRNIFQGTMMSGQWRWSLSSQRTLLGSWQKAKRSSTGSGPTAGSGYLATSKLGATVMGLSKWVSQTFTEYERENNPNLASHILAAFRWKGCTSCFFAAISYS